MDAATPASVVAWVAAVALHAGFQLTVTLVVYPALARVAREDWHDAHDAHGRAIAPLVGMVYGALVVCGAWVLADGPGREDPLVTASGAAVAGSLLLTAAVAAPTHGRLAAGRDTALVRRLLRSDRGRAGFAVGALVLAAAAVLT